MENVKVHIMDGGYISNVPGEFWGKEGPIEVGVPSIYIEHPKAKILLDTGFDQKKWHVEESLWNFQYNQSKEQRLDFYLDKLSVDPDEIDFIIPSHFHSEHIGFMYMFKNATCIVQYEELRHAYVPERFEEPLFRREMFDLATLKYKCIEGDYNLFPEIQILSTPGHSAGHQCVAVKTQNNGTLLFTGDAIYTREMYENGLLPKLPYDVNTTQMIRSIDRISSYVNANNATLIFYHDIVDFNDNVKKFPEYYD